LVANEVISPIWPQVFVLVVGQDEGGAGYIGGSAGACGDVLEGGPALGEQGEPAFAAAAQFPRELVAEGGVRAWGVHSGVVEERVAARIDLQQQTIERHPVPVTLIAVMDEAVLHRRVGSDEIRHRQLQHLAEQGQCKHIGIQIVSASRGANAGHVGAFTIASLDEADVMLMGAIEDVTTDQRATIRAGFGIFDRVRLDAFSGPESLELILKAAEECKP
jgi:hypothetical protein